MKVISVLGRKGRCERASIDEVYLDLTDAAEAMLLESPPEMLEKIDEEALKSHVLGLNEVLEKKLKFVVYYIYLPGVNSVISLGIPSYTTIPPMLVHCQLDKILPFVITWRRKKEEYLHTLPLMFGLIYL